MKNVRGKSLIQKIYCVIYQLLVKTFGVEDNVGDECHRSNIAD